MIKIEKLPAVAGIQAVQPGARDSFLVCDLPGLAEAARGLKARGGGEWCGGRTNAESADMVARGDLLGVPAADAMLGKLEDLVFEAPSWEIIDDVCGAVPNVPNYLAGIPETMMRLEQEDSPAAPLAVFVDITSSAAVPAEQVRARGCAALALVRMLSNRRPVELWVKAGLGERGRCYAVLTRVETAPLDLARAAHVLTCPSVSRGICYSLVRERLGADCGGWDYGDIGLDRKFGAESMARVVNPGSEVLYVAPVHVKDKSVSDPVTWIREKLAEFGGLELQAA